MELSRLDEPFAPGDIEWRIQQSGKSGQGNIYAMVLAYVTNRAIMSRLDEVCGKAGWRNEYLPAPAGGVMCGISIKVDGEWITKWDAAENTEVEAVKGGMSGAMKRAAVQWGIGRYLYNLETGFAQVSTEKRNDWHRAKLKDNTAFWWAPPQLPSWALPATESKKQTNNESKPPKPKPSAQDILSAFTEAAHKKETMQELQTAFQKAWKMLDGAPEQAQAKEVYDLKKSELEGEPA